MTKRLFLLSGLLFLLFAFMPACGGRKNPPEGAGVGLTAPGFELKDLKGQNVSLEQHRGKIVLLDFWAVWCGPCRMSMPLMEKLQKEYKEDVVLLAINLEEPEDLVREYVEKAKVGSTVLLDSEGQVARAYQIVQIPMHVLIDREGIIRHLQVGWYPAIYEKLKSEIESLRKAD